LHVRRVLAHPLLRQGQLRARLVDRYLEGLRVYVEQRIAAVDELVFLDVYACHRPRHERGHLNHVGVDVRIIGRANTTGVLPIDETADGERERCRCSDIDETADGERERCRCSDRFLREL
jgi:hypothetical protein